MDRRGRWNSVRSGNVIQYVHMRNLLAPLEETVRDTAQRCPHKPCSLVFFVVASTVWGALWVLRFSLGLRSILPKCGRNTDNTTPYEILPYQSSTVRCPNRWTQNLSNQAIACWMRETTSLPSDNASIHCNYIPPVLICYLVQWTGVCMHAPTACRTTVDLNRLSRR